LLDAAAVPLLSLTAPPQPDQANLPIVPRWQQPLNGIPSIVDPEPATNVRHHDRVGGEHPVGDEAADIRVLCCGEQASAGALADAEQADAPWVGIRASLQVTQRRPRVLLLVIGQPLQCFVPLLLVAVALVAQLERKDVITGVHEMLAVGHAGPAVGAKLDAEQDDTLAGPRSLQITALERQTVGGREADVLRLRHRLAARDDE